MTAPDIFDRKLYAARRLKSARERGESFLTQQAGEALSERLAGLNRNFRRGLDLGSRMESFALVSPAAGTWIRTAASPNSKTVDVIADEEALPFAAESFDLVVSVLILHAVNDLPGTLVQIRRALAPGGLFLAALFGGSTLTELRRAFAAGESEVSGGVSPRVSPFADVRDAGALLQRAGFAGPVADVERLPVRYGSFDRLVGDLRALGETNVLKQRRKTFLSRGVLAASLAHYAADDGDADGKLRATFDILYLTGQSPG
ncbi:MAG TPA: methyltransferase domain-containing protein [Rhizomicrobium sp.]